MSSLIFNANEVLDVAKRIEKNGIAYYTRAAELMSDDAGKKLMKDLAEMEAIHEQIFTKMQATLTAEENAEGLDDFHNDAYQFLQGMADKYVFNPKEDPLKVLSPGADTKTILDVAIEREKDSIIFFEGVKAMVPEKFGLKRLDEIIGQEMGHVIILTRYRDKL
jgi:rubrerythrin